MKKSLSLIALVLATVLTFSACKAGGSNTQAGGGGQDATLAIGVNVLDTQMANKNPFATSGTYTNLMTYIYEGLLYFNPVSGQLVPALADSYTWSNDHKTLTCKLNTKAKWQDGQAFTADDVVFTYQMLKNNPVMDQYGLWKKLDTVTANGDSVVFACKDTFNSLPNYLSSIYIVPKHIWSSQTNPSAFLNENPIGTGPFVFKSYTVGTVVKLDANKDYWRGAPKVAGLDLKMYNSSPNLTLALLKGDVQATEGTIAMANIPEFKSKPNAKLQIYAGLTNQTVLINNEKPLLNDVNVRKAMIMAFSQSDLITKGEYNAVFPESLGWVPDLFGDIVSQDAKNLYKNDVEGAKKVLESAGYTKGSDGIYQKNGQRLSFTYYNSSGAPAQQMEAGMIQQWLLNVGIEIIPKLATSPELTKLAQSGSYDLLQCGVSFPADPFAALDTCFNSAMTAPVGQVTPGLNYFRYRNADVDSLLKKVSGETDAAKQKDLYVQIQNKIAQDYPFIPMYNIGGHIPYYDGAYTGWDEGAPILSPLSIIKIYKK